MRISRGCALLALLLCRVSAFGQALEKEYVYLGGKLIAIESTGNRIPTQAAFTPPTDGAASGLISFSGSDPDGAGDIASLRVIIGTSREDSTACSFTWTRATPTQVTLSSGGSITLGQTSPTAENSYCRLSGQGGAYGQGATANDRQVSFTLTMLSSNQKNIYIEVKDAAGATTVGGWYEAGSWLIQDNTGPGTVQAAFSGPSSAGYGMNGIFTFELTHSQGVDAVGYILVIIGRPLDGNKSCFFSVATSDGHMQLRRDPEMNPEWGQVPSGSATTAENGRCKITGTGSSISRDGTNKLRASVNLEFLEPYIGERDVYITTLDPQKEHAPPWALAGTWMVSNVASTAPLPISLSLPGGGNSGYGLEDTFTFTLTDPNGASDIESFVGVINSIKNGTFGCYFFYDPPSASGAIQVSPSPETWTWFSWPASPATGSGMHGKLQRCQVDGSKTRTKRISATAIELQIGFKFGDDMKTDPHKKVYAVLRDKAQHLAPSPIGDDVVGYYSVQEAPSANPRVLTRLGFEGNLTNSVDANSPATAEAGTVSYTPSLETNAGQAAQLNGATRIRLGGTTAVESRTYAAWVYWNGQSSGAGAPLMTSGTAGSGNFFGISGPAAGSCTTPSGSSPRLYWDHWHTACTISTATIPLNQWTHVAVSVSGGTVTFYKNGQKTDTVSNWQYTAPLNTFHVGGNTLGGTTTGTFFSGKIDDLRVFNYALSNDAIASIANEFRPEVSCRGVMELWPNYLMINPATPGEITVNLPSGCSAAEGYSLSVQPVYGPPPFVTAPFSMTVAGNKITVSLAREPNSNESIEYTFRVVLMKNGVEYTCVDPGDGQVKKLEAGGWVRVSPTPQNTETSVTPSTGAGVEQTFKVRRYSERSWNKDTTIQHVLFGPPRAPTSAIRQCYIVLWDLNRRVSLFNNEVTAATHYDVVGPVASTGTAKLANSQCVLHQFGSVAYTERVDGNDYHTWSNKITFVPETFAGEKGIWALENADGSTPTTNGMKKAGSWMVTAQ